LRVIRTEMYFDPREIIWPLEEQIFGNPGVSVAFFGFKAKGDELNELPIFHIQKIDRKIDAEIIRPFVDQALRNESYPFLVPGLSETRTSEFNRRFVDYIFEQPIIIEQSPPEGMPFINLLKHASAASIGAYVGTQAADGHPLLFLTVPAGIIVVGSAIAISNAINRGLNKAIERIAKSRRH
jgi:hypothetical protein